MALLGVAVVLLALTIAVVAAGPLLREIIGAPQGFGSDVTLRMAYVEAMFVQLVCVALALAVFGATAGSLTKLDDWRSAWWVVNPVSVGWLMPTGPMSTAPITVGWC